MMNEGGGGRRCGWSTVNELEIVGDGLVTIQMTIVLV